MSSDNKEVARRFMDECWSQGRLEAFRELVSNECRYHDPVFPSLTSGAEDIMRHISTCRSGFPDLKFTIEDTIAERNEVVIHWKATGTHKAQFLGISPTNRAATVSGTSIFRVEGGKIVEQWADWNLMTLMEQLGVAAIPKMEGKVSSR